MDDDVLDIGPRRARPWLRLLLVGDRLHVLDVDSHSVTAVSGLPSDRYVVRIAWAGGSTYALLMPCTSALGARTSVVRLRDDGSAVVIASGQYSDLLDGGDHVWAVSYPDTSDGPIVLDPLDGTRPSRLPPGVAPIAGSGTMIVASSPIDDTSMELALFDPVTSTVRTRIGAATAFGVSADVVLWRGADCARACCACSTSRPARAARSRGRWARTPA